MKLRAQHKLSGLIALCVFASSSIRAEITAYTRLIRPETQTTIDIASYEQTQEALNFATYEESRDFSVESEKRFLEILEAINHASPPGSVDLIGQSFEGIHTFQWMPLLYVAAERFMEDRYQNFNTMLADTLRGNGFWALLNITHQGNKVRFENRVHSTLENPMPLPFSRKERISQQSGSSTFASFCEFQNELTRQLQRDFTEAITNQTPLDFTNKIKNHPTLAKLAAAEILSHLLASPQKRIIVCADQEICKIIVRFLTEQGGCRQLFNHTEVTRQALDPLTFAHQFEDAPVPPQPQRRTFARTNLPLPAHIQALLPSQVGEQQNIAQPAPASPEREQAPEHLDEADMQPLNRPYSLLLPHLAQFIEREQVGSLSAGDEDPSTSSIDSHEAQPAQMPNARIEVQKRAAHPRAVRTKTVRAGSQGKPTAHSAKRRFSVNPWLTQRILKSRATQGDDRFAWLKKQNAKKLQKNSKCSKIRMGRNSRTYRNRRKAPAVRSRSIRSKAARSIKNSKR
jgi:hypothetical protein